MKTTKILSIFILFAILFAACGQKADPSPSPSDDQAPVQSAETQPSESVEPIPSVEPSEDQLPAETDEPSQQSDGPEVTPDNATSTNEPTSEPVEAAALTEGDFILEFNGKTVYFNQPIEEMIGVMGSDYAYAEAISCAYDGLDKTYGYDEIDIYSYPDGDNDFVNEMLIFGEEIKTARGISVGAARDEVIAAYGDGTEVGAMLEYEAFGHLISFTFSNGVVSDIDFMREA